MKAGYKIDTKCLTFSSYSCVFVNISTNLSRKGFHEVSEQLY